MHALSCAVKCMAVSFTVSTFHITNIIYYGTTSSKYRVLHQYIHTHMRQTAVHNQGIALMQSKLHQCINLDIEQEFSKNQQEPANPDSVSYNF